MFTKQSIFIKSKLVCWLAYNIYWFNFHEYSFFYTLKVAKVTKHWNTGHFPLFPNNN